MLLQPANKLTNVINSRDFIVKRFIVGRIYAGSFGISNQISLKSAIEQVPGYQQRGRRIQVGYDSLAQRICL